MGIFNFFIKNFELYFDVTAIKISYGKQQDAQIIVVKSVDDAFWDDKQDIAPEKVVWKDWKNAAIPFLFDKSNKGEIITKEGNQIIINYDIVASAFYFLSGWNEYVSSSKDDFNRVKYDSTLIHQLKIDGVPVVNYYFDILRDAIHQITGKAVKHPGRNIRLQSPCRTTLMCVKEAGSKAHSAKLKRRNSFLFLS